MTTTSKLTFTEISLCKFTDLDILGVAEHLGVPETEIRAYLKGTDRDVSIDAAFYRIAGMYPIRRLPTPTHT
jgi:hypothetical protein